MYFRKLVLIFSIVLTSAIPAAAQAGGWQQLTTRTVADHAEVDVVSGLGKGRFSEIRLCVGNRAVNFRDLDVVFGNGGHQDVAVRSRIGAGQCIRAIDLRGGKRFLWRIVMKYDTARNVGPQALVTVFGR